MLKVAKMLDADSVTQIALSLWPDHKFGELKKEMEAILDDGNAVIVMYLDDKEKLAGFAQCQLRYDYVEGTMDSPVGYLEAIYVKEEYRKQGIARKLLEFCQDWSKEKECQEFASDCELTNTTSFDFHLKVGFTEANRIICFTKRL